MREWWIFTSQYIVRIKSYNWNWCLAIEKSGVSGWLDVDQNIYLTTLRIRHSWVSIIFSNSKIETRYQMRWQRCWEWDPNNWYTRQCRLNWKSCWQRIHIGLTPDGNADGSVSSGFWSRCFRLWPFPFYCIYHSTMKNFKYLLSHAFANFYKQRGNKWDLHLIPR